MAEWTCLSRCASLELGRSVGRSETAELAQVGIMFFSAAQTPPSHHSLALSLSPYSTLYSLFPLFRSLFMKSFHHPLPSPSGFLGRASLIAHARPAKNRNIGLAAEQRRRSWIQDDEVLHSHFHMPSLYLLPTVTQHGGVCLRNSPSVSWALGPFAIPVLCYAVLVILASCHENVTIALFSSLLCHALRN